MAANAKKAFSFTSDAVSEDTFTVVRFKGDEGLSTLYRFDILLASKQDAVNALDVVRNTACLTMERKDSKLPFHGILESFEQLQKSHGLTFYRAVLMPKLWWLTLTHHNQVFLNKTCPQFLQAVLQDGGLEQGSDFDLRLRGSYPSWEFVCQFDESHFAFVSRWMERYGMYYFFEQGQSGEKLVITDDVSFHSAIPGGKSLRYAPKSGLEAPYANEIVTSLHCDERLLPQKVLLKDYNYEKPSLSIQASAQVSPQGAGEVYVWGEHVRTQDEASSLATVRAQELACRGKVYYGVSSVSMLRSGYTFGLEQHFMQAVNREYLLLKVGHEANQTAYLTAGMPNDEAGKGLYYRNTFEAIPSSAQYRPQRTTKKPRFHGVMNAHIDAAGSGQYAEVDNQGRYKVILPFDLSGRKDGHASSWLRMMQPYAGDDHGLHMPLHKGTEVLVAFREGDPDRPFITSVVPNPTHKSLVTSAGNTKSLLTTSGQNIMHIEDKKGSERILLRTPTEGTYMRLGEPNDPPSAEWEKEEDKVGFKLQTNNAFEVFAGSENEVIMIENSANVLGGWEKWIGILATEINIGDYFQWFDPFAKKYSPLMSKLHSNVQRAVGVNEELNETQLEIANDVLKMRQMRQKLVEQETELTTTQEELTEQRTELEDTSESIYSDNIRLVEVSTRLRQDVQRLEEEVVVVNDEVMEAAEEKSDLQENVDTLYSERTELFETITSIGDSVTRLHAIRDNLAEDLITVTDLAIKV